ncbi:MAG: hypothetical protein O6934_04620 [SAR324 cluster bacterium]|nr:hypothetical protein [SAR324 cluster bacterium]
MSSYEAQYREKLQPFKYQAAGSTYRADESALAKIRGGLADLPDPAKEASPARLLAALSKRERAVHRQLSRFYSRRTKALAKANLTAKHAFEILFDHARLLDVMYRFAFDVAMEDLPLLVRLLAINGDKELQSKKIQYMGKSETLRLRQSEGGDDSPGEAVSESERRYYEELERSLDAELDGTREMIARLEAGLPVWRGYRVRPKAMARNFVLFARGGYGRAEMSFSSDLDSGCCVDTRKLKPGEVGIYQELIVRAESLLNGAGTKSAHQYFETEEDLSRFMTPEAIHTASAIFESRVILGNPSVLQVLKENFLTALPYEEFLKVKIGEYEAQARPSLTEMDLKEDKGGLRTIQVPLWILGVTHRAKSFMTCDLIEQARRLGLLSIWEAARLLLGLELLYDLRNFIGMAEQGYYDQEARASNVNIGEFKPNRINDALARLYLFRRIRFDSLDVLDTSRLRLVADVERICDTLLGKILDQTISHDIAGLRVSVHLGNKRITRLQPRSRKSRKSLRQLLAEGAAVLELFAFIARTDYDLSYSLKDILSAVVSRIKPATGKAAQDRQARQFAALMAAPYAHRALATMLEISDPLAEKMDTLAGRFIPELDRLVFLVRDAKSLTMPVHTHLVECVANGQRALAWLKTNYQEFHALLEPGHVLAMKWSLFLHGLGKRSGGKAVSAQSAALAAEVLGRLGFRDEALERQVRLLVEHHDTMVRLSRTATYLDHALVQFFEVAGREIANVTLLFLVNRAVLMASGFQWGEVANLNRLFEEISKILAAARGVPERSRSLEIINAYLYQKKEELQSETRIFQLLQRSFAVGMDEAVYAPLRKASVEEWRRLKGQASELDGIHKNLVLEVTEGGEQERLLQKMMQQLRNSLSPETILRLTRRQNGVFSWFFSGFPNRYLLATAPQKLAAQLTKFAEFDSARVLADVVAGSAGESEGLLIYTRQLENSHSQVAYMLSRMRINIISGKVNRVQLGRGEFGYCYYFQISPLAAETRLSPRDMENMIVGDTPREFKLPPLGTTYRARGRKVEFLGDDGKGYYVKRSGNGYARESAPYKVVRIVLPDEPFLFYKVARAFDLYEVEIQQSLITTTGNQVVDYFYLREEDYDRLLTSSFEERFLSIVEVPLI